ncbi:sugar transferase [Winogradskyella aurantiaca]|uniref:sugar transferase n=1 Tax=Winogradskyella aurantiaca TaxID=2219558 RepID=UPI000E1DA5D4|nr:sugar transferase [Winogradskyella aurantiaca]
MLSQKQRLIKRGFDVLLCMVVLPVLVIPFTLIFLLMAISLNRWAWFQQLRIGQYGRPFTLYKLRTLRGELHEFGLETEDTNSLGRWVRNTHIDEWPQLLNILKGDMSFVGPRPDLPGYADTLHGEDRLILDVKPGITGPASLKYRSESRILKKQSNPHVYYHKVIWPDKVQINKTYVKNYCFSLDLQLLFKTFVYAFK